MKIGFNFNIVAVTIAVAVVAGSAWASPSTDSSLANASREPTVNTGGVTSMTLAAPTAPPLPMDSKQSTATADSKDIDTKSAINKLESGIPDSVKEIVSHLDKTGSEVTLEDLNSARQAVAKIEALIDIEKHLAELEKIRQERDKVTAFSATIPSSALRPPQGMGMRPPSVSGAYDPGVTRLPMQKIEQDVDLVRVVGKNGNYEATLKTPLDKMLPVKVGEKMADGTRIVSIGARSVVLERDGVRKTLHVKNIDTVFGNAL
jgi:hypothetical protein